MVEATGSQTDGVPRDRGIIGESDHFAGHVDHGTPELDTDNRTTAMNGSPDLRHHGKSGASAGTSVERGADRGASVDTTAESSADHGASAGITTERDATTGTFTDLGTS